MTIKEISEKDIKLRNKYVDNESHKHFCFDELRSSINDSLNKIYNIWNVNNLGCLEIKKDLNEILHEASECYHFCTKLEDYANELEKKIKEDFQNEIR